ncbi:MAG: Glycosyl transferase, group 2 family protein [Pseudolabrys sp.]|jgi:cellulose synthase/poly-beta-1,6-N-acetylglucosamine synthase-like glycosyltransferase|nr:Glycosyl transferase, group 2 family protein [Pseudolabrys sp.]
MGLELRRRRAFDGLEAVRAAYAHPLAPSCTELDCMRGWLSPATVAFAEQRSRILGIGADRVLISAGTIDEEIYGRALADSIGLAFETLTGATRTSCPLDDERLLGFVAAGMMPFIVDGELRLVVAPRELAARRIIDLKQSRPELVARLCLTTEERLRTFVERHCAAALGKYTVHALAKTRPDLSAGPEGERISAAAWLVLAGLAGVSLLAIGGPLALPCGLVVSVLFWAWIGLRAYGVAAGHKEPSTKPAASDLQLPTYTVIVALYREVVAVEGLLRSLGELDYPREKLDVKFVVEPDDAETRRAIELHSRGQNVDIIVAPDTGPRTKPKALNAALPFARGNFTVIFDAEDRPEPDQLRRALHAFRTEGRDVACVQAALTIDNAADGWLAGMFTAEYCAQFDMFLPALGRLGLPLPLGGTSNHFRTAVLRAVGSWDPYNVTEDADLGIRLARHGYRAVAIGATTYEEAPARLGGWIKQRTRWFKGWMQTWLVHMRHPARLYRELGLPGFLAMQLTVGGSVFASLVHPLMLASLLKTTFAQEASSAGVVLFSATAMLGYGVSGALSVAGLARRKLTRHAWVLLILPLHWLLLSAAAWRALFQLIRRPYYWEKTEHGLARRTRRPTTPKRSRTVIVGPRRAAAVNTAAARGWNRN